MNSEDDKLWDEVASKLRKVKGLCPLTPEDAAAAFDQAPDAPLSEKQLNSIVESVTSSDLGAETRPVELSVPEKILLAADHLHKQGQSSFSAEALIVACWQKFPRTFGLKGYADQYPDSNKILNMITGEKGLGRRGWLCKTGAKLYALTGAGHKLVRRLMLEEEERATGEAPDAEGQAIIAKGSQPGRFVLEKLEKAWTGRDRARVHDLLDELRTKYTGKAWTMLQQTLPEALRPTAKFKIIIKESLKRVCERIEAFRSQRTSTDAWLLSIVYEEAAREWTRTSSGEEASFPEEASRAPHP